MRTRVGHSFIKADMARTGAVFGGEHSGHFYFRDFWRADSGMLAALHVLAALGGQARTAVRAARRLRPLRRLGEINSEVADAGAAIDDVEKAYAPVGGNIDHMDGLTCRLAGRVVVQPATRPTPNRLLRLNVEARDDATMSPMRDEVLARIRGGRETLMSLDPLLLEILACPCPGTSRCGRKPSTAPDPRLQVLRTAFPVRDDIPVMLLDEAKPFPAAASSSS